MSAEDLLPHATAMGAVTLLVRDPDAMTAYYRDGVGLDVFGATAGVPADGVVLGRGATPVVVLRSAPGLLPAGPREAGLFHTAILFDGETALAAAVHSVATRFGRFEGSADHGVSRAFYFSDPEGNGVELYSDRARSTWSWTHGSIEMGTAHLDPNRFIAEHATEAALADPRIGAVQVGHVHLQVGDVAAAHDFYVRRLGFERTLEMPGQALFVSAGGYHHHMAMNTWRSAGAGRRGRTLGLGEVGIRLPAADDLGALGERMRHTGVDVRDDGRSIGFDDPWGNRVQVEAAG